MFQFERDIFSQRKETRNLRNKIGFLQKTWLGCECNKQILSHFSKEVKNGQILISKEKYKKYERDTQSVCYEHDLDAFNPYFIKQISYWMDVANKPKH